jgi:hypothetical protein
VHYKYEVHIVGYHGTCLGVERNRLKLVATDAPLSEIFTPAETDDLAYAQSVFRDSCQHLLSLKSPGVGHVKLEELREDADMTDLREDEEVPYPLLPPSIGYNENQFVGAWGADIHIEGALSANLTRQLRREGWIYLEYEEGTLSEVVLTKHYADDVQCQRAFALTRDYLDKRGGLNGHI